MKKTMLHAAIAITADAFSNIDDKGGVPYIMHCLYVMEHTHGNDDVKCAAVLHDIIEDTDWTYDLLSNVGFSSRTIYLISLVTRVPGESYEDFIRRAALDVDATNIKKADLEHNSTITRLKGVSSKDFDRIVKYHKAYWFLTTGEGYE